MATHNINFKRDVSDEGVTFTFAVEGARGEKILTGYAKDYKDGARIMKQSAVMKEQYTAADRENSARLAAMTPIRTGDTVIIEGKQYTAKIIGDYSDAGRLIPA